MRGLDDRMDMVINEIRSTTYITPLVLSYPDTGIGVDASSSSVAIPRSAESESESESPGVVAMSQESESESESEQPNHDSAPLAIPTNRTVITRLRPGGIIEMRCDGMGQMVWLRQGESMALELCWSTELSLQR